MPFVLWLPQGIPAGWSARIYDNELPEEPHVTVRFKTSKWRISIRSGGPLDREPPLRDLNVDVLEHVRANLQQLAAEWDRIHPHMLVNSPMPQTPPAAKKTKKTKKSKQGTKSKGKTR